jgi:hypothetical protein
MCADSARRVSRYWCVLPLGRRSAQGEREGADDLEPKPQILCRGAAAATRKLTQPAAPHAVQPTSDDSSTPILNAARATAGLNATMSRRGASEPHGLGAMRFWGNTAHDRGNAPRETRKSIITANKGDFQEESRRGNQDSGRNRRRSFVSLRRFFASTRRSTAARDGRVFTRFRGGLSTATIICRSRS